MFPYDYDSREQVNIFLDNQTALLKDIRKVNNIWRYVRDGFLGEFQEGFIRQFYFTYDYKAIAYDTEEQFAYRLAGKLEGFEPEIYARCRAEKLIRNPFINVMRQGNRYLIGSQRNKQYSKQNAIGDAIGTGQRSNLGVNGTTRQEIENRASQGASDNKEELMHQDETMKDFSQTDHNLERMADRPQDADLTSAMLPIGWTGTAGAVGTATKNDHYPKAEALIALPWNEGYSTTQTLTNHALDTHDTEGHESKDENLSQNRTAALEAYERGSLDTTVDRGNEQSVNRNQHQDYSDNMLVAGAMNDEESAEQIIGLEGRTVGEVWAEWNEQVRYLNAIDDLCNMCRECFLLTE